MSLQMAGVDPEAAQRSREVREEQMRSVRAKASEERAGAERYCRQSAANLQTLKDMLPSSQGKADAAKAKREVGAAHVPSLLTPHAVGSVGGHGCVLVWL
jgi:hypothetical protein